MLSEWPPSRLLRVNLDLIAPLIANRSSLARVLKPKGLALTMRFMSLRIATPSLAFPTTSHFDDSRHASGVSHVAQIVRGAIRRLASFHDANASRRRILP